MRLRLPHQALAGIPAVALLAIACTTSPPATAGQWTGDLGRPPAIQRLEIEIDSSGKRATITLPGWQLDKAVASALPGAAERSRFEVVVEKDTVRFEGAVQSGTWIGEATRGTDVLPFVLQRLYPLSDAEWLAIVGTYRAEDGHLLGIAPFSEFGERPLIVDYSTGRIGPLLPVSRDRFLVGHSLMTPMFPADTLTLTYGPAREVRSIGFVEQGRGPVRAERVATRDSTVEFRNGPVLLSGTLTLPPGPPPYPAIVLVHGSNALTRDVFGPWTRYFAGQGFAVLAYDKRGTGHSTGDWKTADFSLLGEDVLSGVRFLAERNDIRADRIGLWGASQAGWIMPLVAARAPKEIAFLIVHAGSGTTVGEEGILYLRNELRFGGLPESSVAIGTRYQALDDSVTRSGNGWERLQQFYDTHRIAETWLWPPRPADDWFRGYYRMLMDFDPVPSWKRVGCPVLLFFGELDANVPPEESWPPIERALRRGGNLAVTRVLLPKANHLFLEARTGARDEYPGLSRFVPGYFDEITRWLQGPGRRRHQ